jgi:hypothetical protein
MGGSTVSYDPRDFQLLPLPRPLRPVVVGYNGIVEPYPWPPIDRQVNLTPLTPSWIQQPPDPILCDARRQLFVDDFMIESRSMTRTFYPATQYSGNPVLTPTTTAIAYPFSDGVWFDPADSTYKMDYWYDANDGGKTARAHSVDGKAWTKPNFGGVENITQDLVASFGRQRNSATVWMDLNDIAARKWKRLNVEHTANQTPFDNRMVLYYSSDGQSWGSPVAQTGDLGALSDRTTFFYNAFRGKWVISVRDVLPASVGRCRRYIEGTDLATMINSITSVAALPYWWGADTLDVPVPGSDLTNPASPALYTLDCVSYESVLLGLFSILKYKNGPAGEWNEINIGFSRDGFYWDRTNRVPVATSINTTAAYNNPAIWNAGNTQTVGGAVMDVGNETWMYTSGINNFKYQAGLWTWRKNGFASLDAGASEATATMRWQIPTASPTQFFVNANAAGGSLKVELLDGGGQVISGLQQGQLQRRHRRQHRRAGHVGRQSVALGRRRPAHQGSVYGTNAKLYSYRYAVRRNNVNGLFRYTAACCLAAVTATAIAQVGARQPVRQAARDSGSAVRPAPVAAALPGPGPVCRRAVEMGPPLLPRPRRPHACVERVRTIVPLSQQTALTTTVRRLR